MQEKYAQSDCLLATTKGFKLKWYTLSNHAIFALKSVILLYDSR